MKDKIKKISFNVLRFIPIIICVVLMCLYLFSGKDISPQELMSFAPDSAICAALFVIALYAFKSLTVFFPIVVLNVLGGFLFEPVIAIAVNCIGVIVELTIPYWVGMASGGSFASNIEKKHPKIAAVFGENSDDLFFLSIFLRALFCLPGDVVSLYFGAIRMPYLKYIFGSTIGMMPGTVAATLLGMNITEPDSPMFWISLILTLGFALASLVLYYWKKRNEKRNAKNRIY